MDHYERFSRGSELHRAKVNSDSLELFPIDNTELALKLFQPLADEVFEHEGEGYTILLPHASSLFPGGYDMLLLQRLVAD